MAEKPNADSLSKKAFVITMVGAAAYITAVFLWVL